MSEIKLYKSFIAGFGRIFSDACYVDLDSGKFRHISGHSFMDSGGKLKCNYEKFLEKYVVSYVHPNDRERFQKICSKEYITTHLTKENPFYSEKFRCLGNNNYRWYKVNIIMSKLWCGHVKRIILATMDMYKDDDFFAGLSHDIRTPMNSIMGFVHFLEKDALKPDKVKYYTRKIADSGRQMIGMLNDLLGTERQTHGGTECFTIGELAEDIHTVIAPLAKAKNQRFEISCGGMDGLYISADKMRLTRVLTNLLTNAVKYTPAGKKTGMLICKRPDEEGTEEHDFLQDCNSGSYKTTIIFKVFDNGIGMNKEFLNKIYEPFIRAENTENVEGCGLGMAIVKNLVEYMGGTITIKSRPGCGTVCAVAVPVVMADAGYETAVACTKTPEKPLSGLNILIGEDNAGNAEIMSLLLSEKGACVKTTCNGAETVKEFEASPPGKYNIILMDIKMPVLDGYKAAEAIRKTRRADSVSVPIVAMTGNDAPGEREKVIAAAMNGYVLKPVNINELEKLIKEITNRI